MDSSAYNKPISWSDRALLLSGFSLIACLLSVPCVFSKSAWAATDSKTRSAAEVEDRINKAIKEAEKKLGANPVVEEVRKDLRTNLVPAKASASQSPAPTPAVKAQASMTKTSQPMVKSPAPAPAAPKQSSNIKPQVEPPASPARIVSVVSSDPPAETGSHAMKFKSADPRKQASELAWKASGTYGRREEYNAAYELTQEALKIDPQNRVARDVQQRIARDIRDRPMDIGGTDKTISPPEGRIALAVALSDGLVTLEEAEDIALKNSLMLESLRHRVAGARHKINEALRAFLPTMNADISIGGGAVGSNQQPYDSEKYLASFSQPLYYGGELIFTLKQAQASLRSDELKYQKERTDILRQLGEAYRNAVNAVYNLNYQQELFRQVVEYKRQQDKAYESRLVAEIEHLEISSIYNQVAFQKETAVTTQKSANLTLCQAIGVSADQPIPVDPTVQVDRLNNVDLEDYLNRVGIGNYDIRIKQATLESAYYSSKVFDAQRMPRVDLRGNVGMAGEASHTHFDYNTGLRDELGSEESANWRSAGRPDLEKEYSLIAEVKMPFGPNTVGYTNQRRFFAPSISSFQGSNDYKHSFTLGVLDRLSNRTDEEIAKADYLKAMAELQKEKTDQEINARQAYYDYESALLQLETSDAKILFRERQVKILEQTTKMEEAKLTELLNEMVGLAEDRYSRITAISSANNALAKMDYLAGTEGINTRYEIQPSQK
jgi:outer membrane protein TolC